MVKRAFKANIQHGEESYSAAEFLRLSRTNKAIDSSHQPYWNGEQGNSEKNQDYWFSSIKEKCNENYASQQP